MLFRGDFSANECSCDISNWFDDSAQAIQGKFLGKVSGNPDLP